ncbi:NADH dehydrogenase [ubiquinone] 1 beta subcomplex subunit 1 [Hyperolius riggenbachi]|uniref:NADH dehydrogenase [ubiquinone] 1 beta subcomplex subunit 1 n=1 Tax=Hyperolius riggenbachi TaxID=752182 RepID=UPI0035A2F37E
MPAASLTVKEFVRAYWMLIVPFAGYGVGAYFDRRSTEQLSMFRNKSKLFQR